jgi:hypothetical protein
MISCKYEPKEACDSIQKTANELMIPGVKITRINELSEPCKKMIDAVKGDAKGREMVTSLVKEVLANVETKTLFKTAGKDEAFPVHSFKNLQKFIKATDTKDGDYKYWRTTLEIEEVWICKLNPQY